MLVDEVVTRLEAQVADLAGRTRQAAELAELLRQNALPASPVAAFVLPLGLRARGEGDAMAGSFLQSFDELAGVLLLVRTGNDATGGRALPTIDALVETTIAAIAGWGPAGEPGVFRLARGQLLSAERGLVLYQLDFAIQRQARIP